MNRKNTQKKKKHCGRNFCLLATRLHAGGAGRCLYRPLVGISERDHRYDDYLNSQECLINEEAAVFLRNYKLLMRADMGKRETSNRILLLLASVLRILGCLSRIQDPGSEFFRPGKVF
jgi:hypothetical protein